MIIVEEVLQLIFETLPVVTIGDNNFIPRFEFGSKEDLIKFINLNRKSPIYPLIWLETPNVKTGDERKKMTLDARLIILTFTNQNQTPRERLESTFKPVLYPLYENIIKALDQSGRTTVLDRDNSKRTEYFNYGLKELARENTNTDTSVIWDALKIERKIKINNSTCPIKISYS